jgi:hypothetical protein
LALGRACAADVIADDPVLQRLELLNARSHLARAIDLHGACGGKKDLERVDRLLKKHAAPAAD